MFTHAQHALPDTSYDVVIIGAGRMGLAAAFYLRRLQVGARVLIAERGGIPSEDGATLHAPGVWHRQGLPAAWAARAAWVRHLWANPEVETGTARPHDPPFIACGHAHLHFTDEPATPPPAGLRTFTPETFLASLCAPAREQVQTLVDWPSVVAVTFDPLGGVGSGSTLALSYGYAAVRLGADLALNTEARLTPGGVTLRRLDVTNTHQIVVAREEQVRAPVVIVAAGADSMTLLEHDLGVIRRHGRAYAQYPQLEVPPAPGLPALAAQGFTVRPAASYLRVLPPVQGADPHGYAPVGGRLMGVPVGTRREVLDAMLPHLEPLPALMHDRLNLGKAVPDVPGAWEARPVGGWPLHERVADGVHLLLGGPGADQVGPSVAYDLAATLADDDARPWVDPRAYRVKVEE
ncbi:FAD dependent oxidoreductase [Deinococcus maricopensis DSM 21211]|uniref:FAD dependent oxidoreductase n=1 Tax=Deinococcus maricopensis (strain DSM 21211 / LMG 22137 / NRRL B-23946 / LB-34) TaxID=709986 RepID=E8UC69_DEIML|nr:FAD dependent oxidoreductase [Deinococcus maricopensis DSM 21211]